MPKTKVVFFREDDGRVPVLDWLDSLAPPAKAKCRVKIERLRELGHEIRRPEADFLRDGIYELRIGLQGRNFRILYFFHGDIAIVLSHGIIKESFVPPKEIDRAILNREKYEMPPDKNSLIEE